MSSIYDLIMLYNSANRFLHIIMKKSTDAKWPSLNTYTKTLVASKTPTSTAREVTLNKCKSSEMYSTKYFPSHRLNFIDDDESVGETRERLQGLEAIGLFSEFHHAKQVYNHQNLNKTFKRHSTIHVTDFMRKEQKTKLILSAGGWEMYLDKKHEFQKDSLNRDVMIKNFFCHSEKLPSFFKTPPASPRGANQALINTSIGNHSVSKIDYLIGKCDLALSIKPDFSSSRTTNFEQSRKPTKLKKLFINMV